MLSRASSYLSSVNSDLCSPNLWFYYAFLYFRESLQVQPGSVSFCPFCGSWDVTSVASLGCEFCCCLLTCFIIPGFSLTLCGFTRLLVWPLPAKTKNPGLTFFILRHLNCRAGMPKSPSFTEGDDLQGSGHLKWNFYVLIWMSRLLCWSIQSVSYAEEGFPADVTAWA